MYFKRIELNGFKSFADPTTIEFTDGITCIVGPNGSGKSNISDAIRWVLGEQSPKNLRGGKMEEVIFAGTQSRRQKGMAEVTLVIDNAEHILPIDFAEVGITRRMYRSGESEYMINRTPCRLRDIRELIMDTGIGVEGYSVIGQGKIADIVSEKMESRREIFEEAAGIVKYRSRKTEAERRLAGASANLDRINDIVGEIEGRIDGLAEESRKATEYLDLREKFRSVEINIILRNIAAAEDKVTAVREEYGALEEAIQRSESEKNENEEALRRIRAENQALEERISSLRDELLKKTEEIHEISARDALNAERRSSLEKDKERLTAEIAAVSEKLVRESGNAQQMTEGRAALSREKEEASEAVRACRERSEALSQSLSDAEDALDESRERIMALASDVSAAKAEGGSIRGLMETLSRRRERLLEETDSDAESKRIEAAIADAQSSLDQLQADSGSLAEELTAKDSSLLNALSKGSETADRIEEQRMTEGRIAARLHALEELEAAREGFGNGVKVLLSEDLDGIIGVLGELLDVPRGWETAIETVLGGKLNDIVCENDAVAKRAIGILKEKKAGRLTFLPLETLRVQESPSVDAVIGCKGYLGLASDRVSCRGGHDKIVQYMLGRVVVCDTLDHALVMSSRNSGPLRFVTLEGEVINAAGAITGGSLKNNTGSILTRKAEKDRLSGDLKRVQKALVSLREERDAFHEQAEVLREEKSDIERRQRENDLKLALAEKEVDQLMQQLQLASAAGDKRQTEILDLEREIAASASSAKAMEEKAAALEKERLEEVRKAEDCEKRCETLRGETDQAIEKENDARIQESSLTLKLQSALDLEARVADVIAELEKEQRDKQSSLESAERQLQQIEQFTGNAADILRQKEAEKTAIEEETARLTEDRQTGLASESACEERRGGLERALYEEQLKKHDADIRLARFEAQSESLKEKLWDDFEMSFAQASELASDDFVMSRALRESREYKERIRALGDVNIGAIEEYKAVKERYDFLTEQRADVLRAMDELNSLISDMDRAIRLNFKESFDLIVENFDATFSELFKGGHATLELENPDDPLGTAIEIEAQPPGKKLQNINLLSGGEKTMTAIALMFAVLKSKPTPFCILDEVEAALDEANIEAFAHYLRHFDRTQFALITHQKATMEFADVLYGVTMPEQGITQVLSLKLGDEFEI